MIKEILRDIWLFIKYLFVMVFGDIMYFWRLANLPRIWMYVGVIGFAAAFFFFKEYSLLFLIILIISFLANEYIKGEWKHHYREAEKKRAIEESRKSQGKDMHQN